MAGEFFVDTSAWYPFLLTTQSDHQSVVTVVRAKVSARQRIVTTNLVVAETHALLLKRVGRRKALVGLDVLGRSTDLLVYSTPELESAARRDWIDRYADQDFSLADAVSFAVMRERRIADVLTLDRRFAAAGFNVLPERG